MVKVFFLDLHQCSLFINNLLFLEIISTHIENTAVQMIQRIDNYLEYISTHDNPTTEDLMPFFHVPIEPSAGFHQELKRYRDAFHEKFVK